MTRQKDIRVGPVGTLVICAIWLVGLVEIVKWVVEGLIASF